MGLEISINGEKYPIDSIDITRDPQVETEWVAEEYEIVYSGDIPIPIPKGPRKPTPVSYGSGEARGKFTARVPVGEAEIMDDNGVPKPVSLGVVGKDVELDDTMIQHEGNGVGPDGTTYKYSFIASL